MRLSWGLIWAQSRYFKALVVVCCVGCSLLFMLWAGYTEQCHSVAQQANACLPRLQLAALVYVRPRVVEPRSTFCTPLFPPEPNVDMPCLPPGCNSLPCRMPPAALTEASSSSQGIFYIIRATGRSLVMNMPREAQSFMQAGPLALKHGSVTSWLSLSRVYSRWISRRPPQFCDQTHCRRPSVIMKLLLLATCLAYAKADGHEGMEHGNIVEELIKAGSLMMRKSSQNKDSCKLGIVAEWGWQVGWFVGWPACIVTSHPTTHDTSIETNSLPLPTIATISRSQITTPTHLWNSHNSSPFSGAAH